LSGPEWCVCACGAGRHGGRPSRGFLWGGGSVRWRESRWTRQNPRASAIVPRERRMFGPGWQPERSGFRKHIDPDTTSVSLLVTPIARSVRNFASEAVAASRGGACLSGPERFPQTHRPGPDKTRAPAQSSQGNDKCLAREGNRSEAEKRVPPGHTDCRIGSEFCKRGHCRFARRGLLVRSGAVRANTSTRTRQNPRASAIVPREGRMFGPGGQPERSGFRKHIDPDPTSGSLLVTPIAGSVRNFASEAIAASRGGACLSGPERY
jgi:hypothetical protein